MSFTCSILTLINIPLLSWAPDNNSVFLKYATTYVIADWGTVHKLRPRLFLTFVVNSLSLWSNSALLQVTPLLLCMVLDNYSEKCHLFCLNCCMVWQHQCWFPPMVFLVWAIGIKVPLSSCVAPCSVDIPNILGHIFICYCIFLATNSFSWLIPSFCVVLGVQYLVSCGCHWVFHLEVVCFLEHRSYHLCRWFHFLFMIVHLFSPIVLLLLVPLFGFSWFVLVFLLPLLVDVLVWVVW